jgi:hypothetical protein
MPDNENRRVEIPRTELSMENLPSKVPQTLFPDLVAAFVPPDTPADAVLELVITIEGGDVPTRELARRLLTGCMAG